MATSDILIIDEYGFILNDTAYTDSVDMYEHTREILKKYIEKYGYNRTKKLFNMQDYYFEKFGIYKKPHD